MKLFSCSGAKAAGRLSLVVLGLVCGVGAYAQKTFEPGYILPLQGDTVRGLIDFRNWAKNPDEISFKLSESAEATSYRPVDIKAFVVGGEKYVSAVVRLKPVQ